VIASPFTRTSVPCSPHPQDPARKMDAPEGASIAI
jgi:hypothetical protein